MTEVDDPFFWIGNHNAVIGASDSGKTWTAKWGVEAMLRQRRHTLIIDPLGVWYGLRSSVDGAGAGFDIPIFGGPRGDVAIRPTDGAAIGGIIVDQRVSAIIDLSQIYSGPEQRLFVRDLVARLRRRTEKANFHFVVDEADEFIPEKTRDDVAFALQEDMLWIAKKGRSSGWVQTLITQRTADVSKSSLSMSQTIIAHQLISPQDQKPFLDYVRKRGTKADLDAIEAKLASLQQGERYLYSPRAHILTLERTPAISTFDSSSTPPAGESRREPKTLAQLDVSAIRAALAPIDKTRAIATIDGVSLEVVDPTELLWRDNRIAELEAANASLAARCSIFEQGLDRLQEIQLEIMEGALMHSLNADSSVTQASETKGAAAAAISGEPGSRPDPATAAAPEHSEPKRERPPASVKGGAPSAGQPGSIPPAGGALTLPAAQQKILDQLAWSCAAFHRTAIERQVLAIVLGAHPRTKGFLNNLGALRTASLIDYPEGKGVALTAAGVAQAAAPNIAGAPLKQLRDQICKWLPPAQARILNILIDRFPHSISRDSLAETLGFHPRTKGFLNNLGRLRSLGLVAGHAAQPRAAGYLFGKD